MKGRGVRVEPAFVFEPALVEVKGDLWQPPFRPCDAGLRC